MVEDEQIGLSMAMQGRWGESCSARSASEFLDSWVGLILGGG